MNNELIKRLTAWNRNQCDWTQVLIDDCRAEIERLSKPYVPMTTAEHYELWAKVNGAYMPIDDWNSDSLWDEQREVEAAVIKRAGLEIKQDDV